MKNPKLGAHISASGGLGKSIQRAEEVGAECIQIFAGSPRRYEVASIGEKEKNYFQGELQEKRIYPVYIHASYLLNLASENRYIKERSLESVKESLKLCSFLGLQGVVYHPGSPKGGDKNMAIEREIECIKKILKETPEDAILVIENTAGEKKIGTNPKEVGYIFKEVRSSRLKVCIDTAHSLESGNIKEFKDEQIKQWMNDWNNEVGLENISLFHINDSQTKAESRHDRHANLGEGYIGLSGLKNLMRNKNASRFPWIIEVPGFDGKGPDKKNLDILKEMRESL